MKFVVKIQKKTINKKGVVEYENLKTVELAQFSQPVADLGEKLAKEHDASLTMYVSHDHPIPEGYASKRLEYTTQIWKAVQLNEAEALKALEECPF